MLLLRASARLFTAFEQSHRIYASYLTDKEEAPILAPILRPDAGRPPTARNAWPTARAARWPSRRPRRRSTATSTIPQIDDTIPPFRPGPEPSGLTAGAWLKRWGVGLAGWGVFVLVIYLTLGQTPQRLPQPRRPHDRVPRRPHRHGRRRAHDAGADLRLRLRADHGDRHRRHLRRRHQDRRLVEALAPGLRGHPPGALARARQHPRLAPRRGHHRLRQVQLRRRAHQRHPLQGHRLRADDGRRAAHREGRHARRRRAPPREHQDDAQAQADDRGRSVSAPASSSASPRSAAARCSPCSSSCSIR